MSFRNGGLRNDKGFRPEGSRLSCLLLCHAGVEILRALIYFFRGQVFPVGQDSPMMPKRICERTEAVSPEHIGDWHGYLATRIHGLLERGVHIGHIEMKGAGSTAQRLG